MLRVRLSQSISLPDDTTGRPCPTVPRVTSSRVRPWAVWQLATAAINGWLVWTIVDPWPSHHWALVTLAIFVAFLVIPLWVTTTVVRLRTHRQVCLHYVPWPEAPRAFSRMLRAAEDSRRDGEHVHTGISDPCHCGYRYPGRTFYESSGGPAGRSAPCPGCGCYLEWEAIEGA